MSTAQYPSNLEFAKSHFEEEAMFFRTFFRDPDVVALTKKIRMMTLPTVRQSLALVMLLLQVATANSGTCAERQIAPTRIYRATERQREACGQTQEILEAQALRSMYGNVVRVRAIVELVSLALRKYQQRKNHDKSQRSKPRRMRHENLRRPRMAKFSQYKTKRQPLRYRSQAR